MNIFPHCKRDVRFLGQVLLLILFMHHSLNACTIFTKMTETLILVGNNEDWYKTNPQVMFYPASEGKYGRMYFGFEGKGYGGMNECGLFLDKCSLTEREITFPADKPFFEGDFWAFVLETCATVDEAVDLVKQYNVEKFKRSHTMLVDSTGNSAVIEWGRDSLEVIYKTGDYQLVTNFTLSDPSLAGWHPCWRFNTANQMLPDCDVSVEGFGAILAAVHQEGNFPTQYSNVYDLKKRVVHVALKYNFNEVVTFDLMEELAQDSHIVDLASLYTNVDSPLNQSHTPKQFQLFQNYPNPFNPSTTIKYTLKEPGHITMKIYNLAGQEIETLENVFKPAGEYALDWRPKGISSGIYIYRLQVGNHSKTRKLILQM